MAGHKGGVLLFLFLLCFIGNSTGLSHCQCDVGWGCPKSQGRHSRHAAINDLIKRLLAAVKIPAHLEATGISRSDGKRPDGATIVSWKGGKVLVWDATCPDTFAPSHITLAMREAGAVADEAERRKEQKYSSLVTSHHFVPIAIGHVWCIWLRGHHFF